MSLVLERSATMWSPQRAAHLLLLLPALAALAPARTEACGANAPVAPTLVKDSVSGQPLSNPLQLVDVQGTLYFAAVEGSGSQGLWRSDGTASGALRLKGPPAWPANAALGHLTAVGNRLFFTVTAPAAPAQLWVSDGSVNGTQAVYSFPSQGLPGQAELIALDDTTLLFTADDGATGLELWRSNGTAAGTQQVADIAMGIEGSIPTGLTRFQQRVFFAAYDSGSGTELWQSDGTSAGRVKDIWFGAPDSNPGSFQVMGNQLFFTAVDGTGGNATLWKTDGTAAGTVPVPSALFPPSHDAPQGLTVAGNTLFFLLKDPVHGQELWKSNGEDVTVMVREIQAGAYDGAVEQLTGVGDRVFFLGSDGQRGLEPWRSDGTSDGTQLVRDFVPGSANPLNPMLVAGPGVLLAQINDGASGSEVWKIDRTGADRLTEMAPGNADPHLLTVSGTRLFFSARDGSASEKLFMLPLDQVDCVPPVIICPADSQVEAVSPLGAYVSSPPFQATDDAITAPTVTPLEQLEGVFKVGDTAVTLTARDGAGNMGRCTFHVIVQDTTPPLLLCPQSVVQEATGPDGALASYFVVASDAVSTPQVSADFASGRVFPLGDKEVHVTAVDEKNNPSHCKFTISVKDTVAPRLTCPKDMQFSATGALTPIPYPVQVQDAVTPVPELLSEHSPGSLFPVGKTQVSLRARDTSGNVSKECVFTVTATDLEPPTVECPGPQRAVAPTPEGAYVHFPLATAADNLGAPEVSYSQEPGSLFPVGETEVEASVTDAGGQTARCTFTVTVLEPGASDGSCQAGGPGSALVWLALALVPVWARRRSSHQPKSHMPPNMEPTKSSTMPEPEASEASAGPGQ
jgi:uncharacterized protein (TIGR03382 family)